MREAVAQARVVLVLLIAGGAGFLMWQALPTAHGCISIADAMPLGCR
jgi:hypothetical protein